jgi:hypothetical protein
LWWCYCVTGVTGLRGSRSVSGDSELFGDLPAQPVAEAPGRGTPRLRQPERHQLGWQVAAIDDLVTRSSGAGGVGVCPGARFAPCTMR